MSKTVVAFLLAGTLFFGAAGCGGTADSEASAIGDLSTVSTSPAQNTTTAPTVAAEEGSPSTTQTTSTGNATIGELGERRNPIPIGREAQVAYWKVKVVDATLDATQIVLDENMFNDPPEDGSQYVLVSLEATYTGQDSSTFWIDMRYSFVGGKGNTVGAEIAVAPDSITDEGEAFTGAAITGNLLFEVASDQVSGGTLLIEEAFGFDKTRVFFAVE